MNLHGVVNRATQGREAKEEKIRFGTWERGTRRRSLPGFPGNPAQRVNQIWGMGAWYEKAKPSRVSRKPGATRKSDLGLANWQSLPGDSDELHLRDNYGSFFGRKLSIADGDYFGNRRLGRVILFVFHS